MSSKSTWLTGAAFGPAIGVTGSAIAQLGMPMYMKSEVDALATLSNNEGVYVDKGTFRPRVGTSKTYPMPQIAQMGGKEVANGAIIGATGRQALHRGWQAGGMIESHSRTGIPAAGRAARARVLTAPCFCQREEPSLAGGVAYAAQVVSEYRCSCRLVGLDRSRGRVLPLLPALTCWASPLRGRSSPEASIASPWH